MQKFDGPTYNPVQGHTYPTFWVLTRKQSVHFLLELSVFANYAYYNAVKENAEKRPMSLPMFTEATEAHREFDSQMSVNLT